MLPIAQPTDMLHAFESAWNQHDMNAFGALFCADATFVNRFGHYVQVKKPPH